MKLHKVLLSTCIMLFCISCSYLDIVPDERPTNSDAFEDVVAAERFLYSCYSYLPSPRHGSASLDLMTGDEVITAFEHEPFAAFPKGNYTASSTVISYWDSFFQGIRQCYILLNNIEKVPNMPVNLKNDYIAQANFLIGYYHLLLSKCYGPIILITEEPLIDTPAEDYLGRLPYEECVRFICGKFDEAASVLPEKRPVRQTGLATSVIAKALKAQMQLYAASPLFNGHKFYSNFKDKEGISLMPTAYDPQKWITAKTSLKAAIDAAEAAGHELYMSSEFASGNNYPENEIQRRLRHNIIDAGNPEILWSDSRDEGYYGIQNKTIPYSSGSAWNGIAPTLTMCERFYTENGLPIDEDPAYAFDKRYELETITAEDEDIAEVGKQTLKFNLNREPRYYAWVAFQAGYYEIMSAESNGAYANDPSYQKYGEQEAGKLVCDFVLGGNCSRQAPGESGQRTNNYAPSGFLNKKGVHPGYPVSKSLSTPIHYPWPIMRLADLYLSYAEACVETNDLEEAKLYTDKIRQRAGIPTIDVAWEGVATLDQSKLREIVRRERQIEFYLENQNFWDLRRWGIAENFFSKKARGMNITANTINDFAQETTIDFERKFLSPTQYLLPIPVGDINKNDKLVQNPGY